MGTSMTGVLLFSGSLMRCLGSSKMDTVSGVNRVKLEVVPQQHQ